MSKPPTLKGSQILGELFELFEGTEASRKRDHLEVRTVYRRLAGSLKLITSIFEIQSSASECVGFCSRGCLLELQRIKKA